MQPQREDLALRIREERERLGFSQADFARMLGITRESLRLYEAGARTLAAEVLAAGGTLGVDVQYVLLGVRSRNLKEVEAAAAPQVGGVQITTAGNVVGSVLPGATVTQINTHKHITKTVAEVRPGIEHITEQQAATLTQLVNSVVETEQAVKREPASHRSVWAALNAHCGVTRYRLIRREDFEKARRYLQQRIGRLDAMASSSVVNGDAWRTRKYAYIKINSKGREEELASYLRNTFRAESLTDLSNDELERAYRYVAGKKRRAP